MLNFRKHSNQVELDQFFKALNHKKEADVLNHLVIDSCIHPRLKSEKSCIDSHMAHASKNDLIIYDRGYPAFWLYAFHLQNKQSFCMRIKTKQSLLVKDFIKSNKRHLGLNYQVNFAQALSKTKHQIISFIRHSTDGFLCDIKRLISYIAITIEAVREGRSVPRLLKNIKNDIHFTAYKSAL